MEYRQMYLKAYCVMLFVGFLVSCQTPLISEIADNSSVETFHSETNFPSEIRSEIFSRRRPTFYLGEALVLAPLKMELPEDPYVAPLMRTLRPEKPSGKTFIDYPIMKFPQAYIASPKEYFDKGIQPGVISVHLRDEYNLRLKEGCGVYSKTHPRAAAQLSAYLKSNQMLGVYDSVGDMTEAEVLTDHAAIARLYEGYIPLRYSLQTYTFSKETDLIPIINHLRTLDFVRSAGFVFLH